MNTGMENETTASANWDQELANAVLKLYSKNPDYSAIERFYAENAEFKDPISRAQGHDRIRRLFGLLAAICDDIQVEDTHHSLDDSQRRLVIDSLQHYKLRWLPFRVDLKNHVELELDDEHQVKRHVDDWPLTSLVTGVRPVWPFGIGARLPSWVPGSTVSGSHAHRE